MQFNVVTAGLFKLRDYYVTSKMSIFNIMDYFPECFVTIRPSRIVCTMLPCPNSALLRSEPYGPGGRPVAVQTLSTVRVAMLHFEN